MPTWIDTHCHLDAPEFSADVAAVRARAATENVALCVIPAVEPVAFEAVRALAHRFGDAYALGIHPMYVARAPDDALAQLEAALARHADDPRLVAEYTATKWLEVNRPDYRDVVAAVLEELANELMVELSLSVD